MGIDIDTILRRLTLPETKMAEIHDVLQLCHGKNKLTKRELQSIIGRLNFACCVIYGGRTFLRRIIDLCNTLVEPNHWIKLNNRVKADLYRWINYMEIFNGSTEIIDRSHYHSMYFRQAPARKGEGDSLAELGFRFSHIFWFQVFTVYLAIQRWKDNSGLCNVFKT